MMMIGKVTKLLLLFCSMIAAFAGNMYHQLAGQPGKNVLYSPYSISLAMGMTYSGARGSTADEMKKALHFDVDQDQLPSNFQTLTGRMMADAANDNQKLNIANGLCLTRDDLGGAYKKLLKDQYDAELFSGDLAAINAWVSRKTEKKITSILDSLDRNSVCVILNAIYFKGSWDAPFKKESTHAEPFKTSAAAAQNAPLMSRTGSYQLIDKEDYQAISIPYAGKHFSMVILLPKAVDGIGKLEQTLQESGTVPKLMDDLNAAPERQVWLTMPKFKLETDYDLVKPCKELGIHDAFEPGKANFEGMNGKKDLYISQIKHKAFLDVNEEGTEAAAATGVAMATYAVLNPPQFRADHPFIFLIRHNSTGTILFMGRIMNPSESK